MNPLFDLSNKKCVIIGGAGRIGAPISRACRNAGAHVVIADFDEKKGTALAKEIGASYEHVDVSKLKSMLELARSVGDVDGIVNVTFPKTANHGRSFADANVPDMLAAVDLHIGGCLSTMKVFAPAMQSKKSGSVIFFGSIYGVMAPRFEIYEGTGKTLPAEYAAAKGAVIMLTKYFASLFGRDGIRVNTISPGGVADAEHDLQPDLFIENYAKHLKIGSGLLSAEDIAGAAVFLLSDASKQMTGQNLIIDGGWTL